MKKIITSILSLIFHSFILACLVFFILWMLSVLPVFSILLYSVVFGASFVFILLYRLIKLFLFRRRIRKLVQVNTQPLSPGVRLSKLKHAMVAMFRWHRFFQSLQRETLDKQLKRVSVANICLILDSDEELSVSRYLSAYDSFACVSDILLPDVNDQSKFRVYANNTGIVVHIAASFVKSHAVFLRQFHQKLNSLRPQGLYNKVLLNADIKAVQDINIRNDFLRDIHLIYDSISKFHALPIDSTLCIDGLSAIPGCIEWATYLHAEQGTKPITLYCENGARSEEQVHRLYELLIASFERVLLQDIAKGSASWCLVNLPSEVAAMQAGLTMLVADLQSEAFSARLSAISVVPPFIQQETGLKTSLHLHCVEYLCHANATLHPGFSPYARHCSFRVISATLLLFSVFSGHLFYSYYVHFHGLTEIKHSNKAVFDTVARHPAAGLTTAWLEQFDRLEQGAEDLQRLRRVLGPGYFYSQGHLQQLSRIQGELFSDFFAHTLTAIDDKALARIEQQLSTSDEPTFELATLHIEHLLHRLQLLNTTGGKHRYDRHSSQHHSDLIYGRLMHFFRLVDDYSARADAARWTQTKAHLSQQYLEQLSDLLDILKSYPGFMEFYLSAGRSMQPLNVPHIWSSNRKVDIDRQIQLSTVYTVENMRRFNAFTQDVIDVSQADERIVHLMQIYERNFTNAYLRAWEGLILEVALGYKNLETREAWLAAIRSLLDEQAFYAGVYGVIQQNVLNVMSDVAYAPDWLRAWMVYEQLLHYNEKSQSNHAEAATKINYFLGKAKEISQLLNKPNPAPQASHSLPGAPTLLPDFSDNSFITVQKGAEAVQGYRSAVGEFAVLAHNRARNYTDIRTFFNESSDATTGLAKSKNALQLLHLLLGHNHSEADPFWAFISLPHTMQTRFQIEEAQCELNRKWHDQVLAPLERAVPYKHDSLLYNEHGLFWSFMSDTLSPFVGYRYRRGYEQKQVEDLTVHFLSQFLTHASRIRDVREQPSSYRVELETKPSRINSRIPLFAKQVDLVLECEQEQRLVNQNYLLSRVFQWSETCSSVSLHIDLGFHTLVYQRHDRLGFLDLIRQFKNGALVLTEYDFLADRGVFDSYGIDTIEIDYRVKELDPVVEVFDQISASVPAFIAPCSFSQTN